MLRPDQIDSYRHDGFLCPVPVLAEADLERFQRGFAELERQLGKVGNLSQAHRYFSWAYDLATHPPLLDVVGSLLGETLLVSGTLILAKYPGDPGYVAWHQDSVYSGWHLSPTTSAWIALSRSVAENGCMRVIPGSHRDGVREHSEGRHADNLLRRGEEIEVEVDESKAHDLELEPGEMSLHESTIIHGSRRNTSDFKRVGFIVRFVTPAHQQRADSPMLLARGRLDPSRPLPVESARPPYDIAEGVRRWQRETAAS